MYFFDQRIWEIESKQQAREESGSQPIRMKWVVCNKGGKKDPDIRARLVACEINTYATDEFYAATPPLEANKMLYSEYASQGKAGSRLQLACVDVKKAYFNGTPRRRLFVRFPQEAGQAEEYSGRLLNCQNPKKWPLGKHFYAYLKATFKLRTAEADGLKVNDGSTEEDIDDRLVKAMIAYPWTYETIASIKSTTCNYVFSKCNFKHSVFDFGHMYFLEHREYIYIYI